MFTLSDCEEKEENPSRLQSKRRKLADALNCQSSSTKTPIASRDRCSELPPTVASGSRGKIKTKLIPTLSRCINRLFVYFDRSSPKSGKQSVIFSGDHSLGSMLCGGKFGTLNHQSEGDYGSGPSTNRFHFAVAVSRFGASISKSRKGKGNDRRPRSLAISPRTTEKIHRCQTI